MSAFSPAKDPSYNAETAAYTGTAGNTATFKAGPNACLVWCDSAAYISVGEGASATVSDTPIPANVPIIMDVPSGSGAPWRVSAIQVAASGNVYAKPGFVVSR